jgi:hypothetical protein
MGINVLSMSEYETRAEHDVTHYYDVVFGAGTRPVALVLYESDLKEKKFLMETDKIKTTETKINS